MSKIKFKNISKKYDSANYVVKDFNLEVENEEFVVIVGPSGCGKSTTLRMLAGLEKATEGSIFVDGELINETIPSKRNLSMVFQSYALYPHMDIYNNLAFALKSQKKDKKYIKEKVNEVATNLKIKDLLNRKPKALSGGQKQRVALGSALIHESDIILMDEPLSNLDAKLRVDIRKELVELHQNLKKTIIYVTHDQVEAMTMASRIVIMKDGKIQQIGSPLDIYNKPKNIFVAQFIGLPQINLINVYIDDNYIIGKNNLKISIPERYKDRLKKFDKQEIILGIRPEDIHVEEMFLTTHPNWVKEFKVILSELTGAERYLHLENDEKNLTIKVHRRYDHKVGETIKVGFNMNKCHFFNKDNEEIII